MPVKPEHDCGCHLGSADCQYCEIVELRAKLAASETQLSDAQDEVGRLEKLLAKEREITAAANKLIADSREQKPVAWLIPGEEGTEDKDGWLNCRNDGWGEFTRPLYADPVIPPASGDADFEVCCNDELVAGASGQYDDALREAQNYASQYAQDGEVKIVRVVRVPLAASIIEHNQNDKLL